MLGKMREALEMPSADHVTEQTISLNYKENTHIQLRNKRYNKF